jgi:DNA invertase Pin-like site-specific DNA recombinase
MPLGTGSERYEALRPMARPRYGLCGGLGRCAQHSPRKLEQLGVCRGPQTPKRTETSLRGGKLRVSIYSRVSTVGQDTDMQTTELREYCKRRGWDLVHEYSDQGVSGAKESRPELNRLIADAHKRRFDAVVVWRFDRFARSVSHLLRALEEFRSLGIEFVSLSEAVDTSTPTGKMVFTVLGAVAELERSLITERVRAGLRNARAKGKKLGRPRKSVDPKQIARLRGEGASWRAIGRKLGVSSTIVYYAGKGPRL